MKNSGTLPVLIYVQVSIKNSKNLFCELFKNVIKIMPDKNFFYNENIYIN